MEIDYKTWEKSEEGDDKRRELEGIKRFKQTVHKLNNFKSVDINLEQLK